MCEQLPDFSNQYLIEHVVIERLKCKASQAAVLGAALRKLVMFKAMRQEDIDTLLDLQSDMVSDISCELQLIQDEGEGYVQSEEF
jgi:hypothetical protein